jgi:cell division protein ZapA (FtsZ GTPase activity inhibitor)
MFDMLALDLRACLQKVSEKAAMIESMDEFEEKREEEKQTL